jgi:hypothetical protein
MSWALANDLRPSEALSFPTGARLQPRDAGSALVDFSHLLVDRCSPCPEFGTEKNPMLRRTSTQVRVFDRDGAINFVADAFARAYPVGTAKQVANDIGESPRTTERWAAREAAMPLHAFLNACIAVPELNAAMRELLGMGETDPRFARALAEFIQAAQRAKA